VALIRSFKDLEVWREAHQLVMMTYRITGTFPKAERFALASQFRRAAVSVPANIAEGFGRRTTKELLQSLAIANGSLEEARYYAFLSRDLAYISEADYKALENQCGSVARLLSGLVRSLRARMKGKEAPVTGHRSPVTHS